MYLHMGTYQVQNLRKILKTSFGNGRSITGSCLLGHKFFENRWRVIWERTSFGNVPDCTSIITRYTVHGRGAKTLDLGNYRLTTVSGIPVLNSFLSCDARNVKYLFFKSAQKVGQKLIPVQMNLQGPGQL